MSEDYTRAKKLAAQAEAALGTVTDPAQRASVLATLALTAATLEVSNDLAGLKATLSNLDGSVGQVSEAVTSLDAEVEKLRLHS